MGLRDYVTPEEILHPNFDGVSPGKDVRKTSCPRTAKIH